MSPECPRVCSGSTPGVCRSKRVGLPGHAASGRTDGLGPSTPGTLAVWRHAAGGCVSLQGRSQGLYASSSSRIRDIADWFRSSFGRRTVAPYEPTRKERRNSIWRHDSAGNVYRAACHGFTSFASKELVGTALHSAVQPDYWEKSSKGVQKSDVRRSSQAAIPLGWPPHHLIFPRCCMYFHASLFDGGDKYYILWLHAHARRNPSPRRGIPLSGGLA